MSHSRTHLVEQLAALGVRRASVLVVHSSYRAVRPVDGGPAGLIEAIQDALGPDGTLVMPSWTGNDAALFDPLATPCSNDLGIVPETFRTMAGVLRASHPFAFAARGLLATRILADPLPLPPHIPESPIGRVHELDGDVLLLGVGQDANTTIHLAELLAGVPYRVPHHITILRDGRPARIEYGENDHCCERFALADDWLRRAGSMREGRVGSGHARLMSARAVVHTVTQQLAAEPLTFLHSPAHGCDDCDAARAGMPSPLRPV